MLKILSYSSLIFLLASIVSCGETKKSNPIPDQKPQQRQDIECSTMGPSSNSCLNQQKLAFAGVKDLEQLATHMAEVTVNCKPTLEEFKEFLCQFNQLEP